MIQIKLFMLIICLRMTETKICKKHIQNSLFPNYASYPIYDIREWVVNLNLQRCTFVEIGHFFLALFLEDQSSNGAFNFYLGICDHDTLKTWQLCSPDLALKRKNECTINVEDIDYGRVHRRFCDINYITLTQSPCNCSKIFDVTLYKVKGFPTCFADPLPDSLCGTLNPCGLNQCNSSTILGRIHSVQCDYTCRGHQPFCEWPLDLPTAQFPKLESLWSDWYELERREDHLMNTEIFYYEAKCVNKYTYQGGLDCLGPGTSCCPPDTLQCKCKIFIEDATLKVRRWVIFPLEPTSLKPRDYDVAEDIKQKIVKQRTTRAPSRLAKREVQFYEDDDEDEDLIDDDIIIEEEKIPRKTIPESKEPSEEDDETSLKNYKEINGDVTMHGRKIVPNKKKNSSTRICVKILIYFFSIHLILF